MRAHAVNRERAGATANGYFEDIVVNWCWEHRSTVGAAENIDYSTKFTHPVRSSFAARLPTT